MNVPTDRSYDFLLNKYYYKDKYTEKKQPGEIWAKDHKREAMQDERTFARFDLLETIINERATKTRGRFQLPKGQKDRARYLIKHLDFSGRISERDYVVMIIVYVKLESDPYRRLSEYYPILNDYEISMQTFVRFLVNLNKYHIEN